MGLGQRIELASPVCAKPRDWRLRIEDRGWKIEDGGGERGVNAPMKASVFKPRVITDPALLFSIFYHQVFFVPFVPLWWISLLPYLSRSSAAVVSGTDYGL